MRTIRKSSLFVILGIVICALIFIGISSLEAQNKGKKPDKPPGKPGKPGEPEATWAVLIPTEGYMFYGMDEIDGNRYYLNNNADIKVSVKKEKMSGPWRKNYDFSYAFKFTLTNNNAGTGIPPEYYVGYQLPDNFLTKLMAPEKSLGKPCCQFPPYPCQGCVSDYCLASCMADFLNNQHPYCDTIEANDYEFFWSWNTIFDFDIETMEVADSYYFGSSSDPGEPGDIFKMQTQYRQGCQKEPAFHNFVLTRIVNYWDDGLVNIWIERLDEGNYGITCEKVWRMWVGVEDPDTPEYLFVKEFYCTRDKGRQTFYYPMKAKGDFLFYIDWIKNPTTNDK